MKRGLVFGVLLAAMTMLPAASYASVVFTTNSAVINQDSVDWCQFDCGTSITTNPSPQPWVSVSTANTGSVGLVGTLQPFYGMQQGGTCPGCIVFSPGEGLIYNGASFGNTPTDIAVTFDQGEYGAGAWISANFFGGETVSVTAFDSTFTPIGSFTTTGTVIGALNSAIFLGAMSDTASIYALEFRAVGTGPTEPDFFLGTAEINSVPEPASLTLLGTGLLGLVARYRRKK